MTKLFVCIWIFLSLSLQCANLTSRCCSTQASNSWYYCELRVRWTRSMIQRLLLMVFFLNLFLHTFWEIWLWSAKFSYDLFIFIFKCFVRWGIEALFGNFGVFMGGFLLKLLFCYRFGEVLWSILNFFINFWRNFNEFLILWIFW